MLATSKCYKRKCKHFKGIIDDSGPDEFEVNERLVCDAFPDGIPAAIAYGENPHTTPYPGDHGIRFERAD